MRALLATAARRRRLHWVMLALWIGPGLIASVIWAQSLAWIVFMSWFANVYSVAAALSAETPVEQE